MPTAMPPIAGHQLQWIGRLLNKSSTLYSEPDNVADNAPHARPAITQEGSAISPGGAVSSGNNGPCARNSGRAKPATAQAMATGSKLRGRNSNSSNSTASSTAATGVPNTAVIPAVAPATSSDLRSAAVRWKYCASSEPMAPPVMMIGPSAPNGPPLPMTMPDDNGFSTATFGDMLLLPNRIASIASGMPCPRIFSEPKRAISPTSSPPTTGTPITHAPRWLSAGERLAIDSVPKKNRLVKKRIRSSSSAAETVATPPMTAASAVMRSSRELSAKSPFIDVALIVAAPRRREEVWKMLLQAGNRSCAYAHFTQRRRAHRRRLLRKHGERSCRHPTIEELTQAVAAADAPFTYVRRCCTAAEQAQRGAGLRLDERQSIALHRPHVACVEHHVAGVVLLRHP